MSLTRSLVFLVLVLAVILTIKLTGIFTRLDKIPPLITDVKISSSNESTVVITWITDEPATSQVEYGTTDALGSNTSLEQRLTTNHSVSIMKSGTYSYFKVKSTDASSNQAESKTNYFNPAPDFTLNTLDGKSISLSDFLGKPILLHFWCTTCLYCVPEVTYIQTIFDKRAREGLVILGVNTYSCEDTTEKIREFVKQKKLTFPILLDPSKKVAQDYNLPGVPCTFLIDAQGTVKAYKLGAFESVEEIDKAIDSIFGIK